MTTRTTTTVTCDRCGQIGLDEDNEFTSWVKLTVHVIDEAEHDIDLCPDCWLAFRAWLKAGATLPLEPARR